MTKTMKKIIMEINKVEKLTRAQAGFAPLFTPAGDDVEAKRGVSADPKWVADRLIEHREPDLDVRVNGQRAEEQSFSTR